MYLPEYEDAILQYLSNCGQCRYDYDVYAAAYEMRDKFPDINNIDQIDGDEFILIIMKYAI